MNFTSNPSMTCQLVGDDWTPVETSADGAAWSGLAPNTPRQEPARVRMWLKGVHITAGPIGVNDVDVDAYRELAGPASGYRLGLIQVITRLPMMSARYEGYKYKRWLQRTIPFFDSDGVANSPWYNAHARADLSAAAAASVELQDYPTATCTVRFDGTATSGRIEELQKTLDFDVFLAVAPRTAKYKQQGLRVLQKLSWTAETRVLFSWEANGTLSYTAPSFVRSATNPTNVSAKDSAELVKKLPISAEGANEAISSSELV